MRAALSVRRLPLPALCEELPGGFAQLGLRFGGKLPKPFEEVVLGDLFGPLRVQAPPQALEEVYLRVAELVAPALFSAELARHVAVLDAR